MFRIFAKKNHTVLRNAKLLDFLSHQQKKHSVGVLAGFSRNRTDGSQELWASRNYGGALKLECQWARWDWCFSCCGWARLRCADHKPASRLRRGWLRGTASCQENDKSLTSHQDTNTVSKFLGLCACTRLLPVTIILQSGFSLMFWLSSA